MESEHRDEELVARETEAAAEEAGGIGGHADEGVDPAERPIVEAGEGEAEGFEGAEELLRDRAEHREAGGNPRYDRPDAEASEPAATYGEADHERSSESEEDREV